MKLKRDKLIISSIIFSTIFLILTLYSAFYPQEWNYGIFHLRYFSISTVVTFIAFGFFFMFKPINNQISFYIDKISVILNDKNISKTAISLALFFFILFIKFKTNIIYGDGGDIISSFLEGSILMTSPLTYILFQKADILGSFLGINHYNIIVFISAFSGVVFVYFTILLSKELFKDIKKRFLFSLFIFSLGSMQLFFGFVEYTILLPTGMIIYIYTSKLYLQNRTNIILPSVILIITFFLHMSAGFLFPSLLYLIFTKKENRIKNVLKVSAIGACIILLLGSYIYFFEWNKKIPDRDVDIYGRFGDYGGLKARFHSITSTRYHHYTMFSKEHLNQIVNEHLLISPANTFLLVYLIIINRNNKSLFFNKKNKFKTFMILFLAFYLFWTLTGTMSFSGRQDWDLFSAVSFPISILGIMLLFDSEKRNIWTYVLIILIVLNLIHAIPWIAANHLGLPSIPTSMIMSNI